MAVYIRVNKSNIVEFIHNNPYDPIEGLGMSTQELEEQGKFVESIPEPNTPLGKRAIPMYNPDTNSVYYEYETIPLRDSQRLSLLEDALNAMIMKEVEK